MAEAIAKFRFKRYKILSSNIEIKDDDNLDGKLNVVLEQTGTEDVGMNTYQHTLVVKISNKDRSIVADVKITGWFEFDSEIDDKTKFIFFNSSAPAILFPYLRAYITTLTGLSGINPIILPTLNLSNRNNAERPE